MRRRALTADIRLLRKTAAALRGEARRLTALADRLEGQIGPGEVLTGPEGARRAAALVDPGMAVHYTDALLLLERIGLTVRGEDPQATLLTAMSRCPLWRVSTTRGVYERVAETREELMN